MRSRLTAQQKRQKPKRDAGLLTPPGNFAAVRLTPFIRSAPFDATWFVLPGLLSVGVALLASYKIIDLPETTPLWAWVVFVLCFDVAHVYATLYRTYLKPGEFDRYPNVYSLVPLIVYAAGVVLYLSGIFWTVLAYVAVFHFIRQQAGFVALYAHRDERPKRLSRLLDQSAIYMATGVPVLFWHCNLPRNFEWFIEGDFFVLPVPEIMSFVWPLYGVFFVAYVAFRLYEILTSRRWNLGKDLIVCVTALTWYVGIVMLNSDFAFTVTNVTLHGVAYMGLVWHTNSREKTGPKELTKPILTRLFKISQKSVVAFLVLLLILAYVEETLWDSLVWLEKGSIFNTWLRNWATNNSIGLAIIVPLLSLPQTTHYMLDGFIWKMKYHPRLRENLFDNEHK